MKAFKALPPKASSWALPTYFNWQVLRSLGAESCTGLGTRRYPTGDPHNLDETGEKKCTVLDMGVDRLDAWRAQVGFCDCHFQGVRCKKKKKDKHLYFTWAHSCVLAPSQNSHSSHWLTFSYKNCIRLIFLQVWVGHQAGWLGCGMQFVLLLENGSDGVSMANTGGWGFAK